MGRNSSLCLISVRATLVRGFEKRQSETTSSRALIGTIHLVSTPFHVSLCCQWQHALLVPQRLYWVQRHRAACGHIAGGKRHNGQQRCDQCNH